MVNAFKARLITNKAILEAKNKLTKYEQIMDAIRNQAELGRSELAMAPDVDLVPALRNLGYQVHHQPEKVIISW